MKPKSIEQPKLPTFDRMEDERLHRKQRLAAGFRLFARYGFDEGTAGHIVARDPEYTDCLWVNPQGMYFGHIRVSDLILVNFQGEVLDGNGTLNWTVVPIHAQILAVRPDVISSAHSHSVYGKAWSTLGRLLDPITQDSALLYEDHALFDEDTVVVIAPEEGKRIAKALGNKKAIILRNHGLLTVGSTVEEAIWWFISMERSCQVQLVAEAAGKPISINRETARTVSTKYGSSNYAWKYFQPLYEKIVRQEPDLLD